MYPEYSNMNEGVDMAFMVILGISFFFLISLTIAMVYFVFRYSKKRNPIAKQFKDNYKLEAAWIIVPTLLVVVMFYYGYIAFANMRDVPEDAMPVKATGFMYGFNFEYENGKVVNDTLVVPVNKAVKLNLFSRDVIHNLSIPAFRIKEDMVPGRENYQWFEAYKEGNYEIYCAEYCGVSHSYMLGTVKVVSQEEFNTWLAQKEVVPANEHPGLTAMKKNSCTACHSFDGARLVGPSFKGLYGKKQEVSITDGKKEITVDDEYLTRAIFQPNEEVPFGYNSGLMQSYEGIVTEEEAQQIVEYLKTLN